MEAGLQSIETDKDVPEEAKELKKAQLEMIKIQLTSLDW